MQYFIHHFVIFYHYIFVHRLMPSRLTLEKLYVHHSLILKVRMSFLNVW